MKLSGDFEWAFTVNMSKNNQEIFLDLKVIGLV